MLKNWIFISMALCGTILMNGCARNISSETYDAKTLGEASTTYEGVIVKARKVSVEEGERLEDSHTGKLVGGLAGAALGASVGGGNARYVTGAAGAIAGAFAGSALEKNIKGQEGMEYVVKIKEGQFMSVVQGMDTILSVGQPVYVIETKKGRSRIVPR